MQDEHREICPECKSIRTPGPGDDRELCPRCENIAACLKTHVLMRSTPLGKQDVAQEFYKAGRKDEKEWRDALRDVVTAGFTKAIEAVRALGNALESIPERVRAQMERSDFCLICRGYRWVTCPACNGITAREPGQTLPMCNLCGGTGRQPCLKCGGDR